MGWPLQATHSSRRRVSLSRKMVLLFSTKYVVPCQIKPNVFDLIIEGWRSQAKNNLTNISRLPTPPPPLTPTTQLKTRSAFPGIRRGRSNFTIFVCCEESVNSAGQLSFGCRSYCGRIHHMQGDLSFTPQPIYAPTGIRNFLNINLKKYGKNLTIR